LSRRAYGFRLNYFLPIYLPKGTPLADPKKPQERHRQPKSAILGRTRRMGSYPAVLGRGAESRGEAGRGIAEDTPGYDGYGSQRMKR
jgi:hypothetical protein